MTPARWGFTPPTPGPATHFLVESPRSVQVGQQFEIAVEALDANNRLATGYTGTVEFSLGSTDSSAVLPANYTFTSSNDGVYWFTVTLGTAESQKIIAADTVTSSITGSASLTVKAAPTATRFVVEAPKYDLATGTVTVTVVALDQYGRVDTGYAGTISLTSSVSGDTLPANYTFSPSTDHGSHTFDVTFGAAAGSQTLTATDAKTSTITGTATVDVEAADAVTHFAVYAWGFTRAGVPTSFAVAALDADNHVVAGYAGTVAFSSSDTKATLPTDYTFQASDDGWHLFSATFETTGAQTISATDTATASITGSATEYVSAQKFRFPPNGWNNFWW